MTAPGNVTSQEQYAETDLRKLADSISARKKRTEVHSIMSRDPSQTTRTETSKGEEKRGSDVRATLLFDHNGDPETMVKKGKM